MKETIRDQICSTTDLCAKVTLKLEEVGTKIEECYKVQNVLKSYALKGFNVDSSIVDLEKQKMFTLSLGSTVNEQLLEILKLFDNNI